MHLFANVPHNAADVSKKVSTITSIEAIYVCISILCCIRQRTSVVAEVSIILYVKSWYSLSVMKVNSSRSFWFFSFPRLFATHLSASIMLSHASISVSENTKSTVLVSAWRSFEPSNTWEIQKAYLCNNMYRAEGCYVICSRWPPLVKDSLLS